MVKKLTIVLLLGVIAYCYYHFSVGNYMTLEKFQEYRHVLDMFTTEHFLLSVLIYLSVYFFVTATPFPESVIITMIGGYLYGPWLGLLLANIGATLGAIAIFLASRHLFYDSFHGKYAKQSNYINKKINEHGFQYLLFLRISPLSPFMLVSVAASFTNIKLRSFVPATFIGLFSCSFPYAYAGGRLGSITEVSEIFTADILTMIVLFTILAVVPLIFHNHLFEKKGQKSKSDKK